MAGQCQHLTSVRVTETRVHVCEECVQMGDRWVHLRMCLECGHVGCCDSSKNKHATKHFKGTHHPVMRSIERGESWVWCYVDEAMVGEATRGGVVAE
ncbi:MAG: UBP-type zinc finger domain-containing protein [Acidobacteriaceae bacterium]